MILCFPDRGRETVAAGAKLSDAKWTAIPSRLTFLVPLALPAGSMKRLGDGQFQDLAFDRIPIAADQSRVWLAIPRLGFFSRGIRTVWAAIAPLTSLSSDFEHCIPEDLWLACLTQDRRFSKGGWIALDTPQMLTVIAVGSKKSRVPMVWKHMHQDRGAAIEIPENVLSVLKRGSRILRLNAGGPCENLLARHGNLENVDSDEFMSAHLIPSMRQSRYDFHPDIPSWMSGRVDTKTKITSVPGSRSTWVWARAFFLGLSLILPCLALALSRYNADRFSQSIRQSMVDAYGRRYGAQVPDPLMALRAKVKQRTETSRVTAAPAHIWLSAVDRLSGQARSRGLKLDIVMLDGVRVEVRGSAADLQSVAEWVSGLSSDPVLKESALVSSEMRMADKRTTFLVRARLNVDSTEKSR